VLWALLAHNQNYRVPAAALRMGLGLITATVGTHLRIVVHREGQ
jgi:hypothetical protein